MDPIPEGDDDPRRPHDNFVKYLELVNNCDEHEPLLSGTPLGHYLKRIQLVRVAPDQLIELYQALNVEQLIPTQSGLARDYRGLAELMGFTLVELEARFKRSHNQAKCLFEAYADRERRRGRRSEQVGAEVTLNDLLKFLEALERFDIIDDFLPTLVQLAQQEQQAQGRRHLIVAARQPLPIETNHDNDNKLQDTTTSQLAQSIQNTHQQSVQLQANGGTSKPVVRYDAFVCFAKEDEDHARELILLLERHNKRVVTMEHLLAGQFEYDALVQMIASECRKVIILLTPNFFQSQECEFQTKFANEIAIKSGEFPKVIPVVCEPVDDSRLPPLILGVSKIDMTRNGNQEWKLRKLLRSLECEPSSLRESPRVGMMYEPGDRFSRFASPVSQPDLTTTTSNSVEPIIDLAYSQTSDSAANLSCQLSIMTSNDDHHHHHQLHDGHQISTGRFSTPSLGGSSHNQRTPSPTPTSTNQLNPFNWYKSFKRKVLTKSPCESIVASTSSRAKLLQEPGDDKS